MISQDLSSSASVHLLSLCSVSIGGGCPDLIGGGGFGACPHDCSNNSDCSQKNSLCCPAACGGHRCLVRCPKLSCSKACSTGYVLSNNCPTCTCKREWAFFFLSQAPNTPMQTRDVEFLHCKRFKTRGLWSRSCLPKKFFFESKCFLGWIWPFCSPWKAFCETTLCSSYEKQGRNLLSPWHH